MGENKQTKTNWTEKFISLFRMDGDIQTNLLNVILIAVLLGGLLACLFSFVMGTSGNYFTVVLLAFIGISLWVVNVKKKTQMVCGFLVVITNLIIFPIMYFQQGGMNTGMPIWMVLGMIFSLLVLRGTASYIVYTFNIIVDAICIWWEIGHPESLKTNLEGAFQGLDIIQSMILVSIAFGAIIKYQSYAYEKQNRHLLEREAQLRIMMEKLEQANQAKSNFLANMSHEIRTPINAVLGMDEMIIRESSDEEITKYALSIESAGQSLLALINDILDFSKVESGKMEILPTVYEAETLLNDCYNMVNMKMKEKKLRFIVQNDSSIPSKIYGDEVRIRQIIINLLINAVKYTESGSVTFHMGWEKTDHDHMILKIMVKDTGTGIREEDQEKIFLSFQRVNQMKTRYVEGSGLGLSLTKQLVELMRGKLTFESKYGEGSTFYVEIPQMIKSDVPMGDFTSRFVSLSGNKRKQYKETFQAPAATILVVDDVEMNIEVIQGLLSKTQVQIDTALSGEECLEKISKRKYDLIYMDHMMPKMDGIETFREIRNRRNHPNVNTPVVVLTANAILGVKQEYLDMGFSAYLSKPIRSRELEETTLHFLPEELLVYDEEKRGEAELKSQSFLEKLSFLKTEMGMAFCNGDESMYRKLLTSYLNPGRYAAVIEMFEKGDWYGYQTQVQAVRDTSKAIGAVALSLQSNKMAKAASENDIEYVKSHQDSFLRNYQDIYARIDRVIREESE